MKTGLRVTIGARVERKIYSGDESANRILINAIRARILSRFPTAVFLQMDETDPLWEQTFGNTAPRIDSRIRQTWINIFRPIASPIHIFLAKINGLEPNDLLDPPLDP